ncbi:hypothetical protein ABTK97_19680, partial [Acinetobacter baumannii]
MAQPLVRLAPKASPSALFAGLAGPRLVTPKREPRIDDVPLPLDYSVRDMPLPAGDPVGIYVPWRLSRIEIAGAK